MSDGTAYSQSGGTVTQIGKTYVSTGDDESAVYVTDAGTLTLIKPTIEKTGDSSNMEYSNFYGTNAGVLAEAGSRVSISGGSVYTNGKAANGVFATGDGTTISLANITLDCNGEGAHGVDATMAATLNASNVTVSTTGSHSGAVATDRGGGYVNFSNGIVKTTGLLSPGLYSTGVITVTGSTVTAAAAECGVIEGLNSFVITDTALTGATCGFQIYQSMSGDSEVGTATVTMSGGSLTVSDGPAFYVTNTDAVISLSGVTVDAASGTILKASTNDSWGTAGENGGIASFTAVGQELTGNIVVDSISTADITLQNSSVLTGAINAENTASSVTLTLDATSTWSVTANSYLNSLTDADTTLANIDDNGYTIYYDSSLSANAWLNGETYTLTDGGQLTPAFAAYYQSGETVTLADQSFVATEPDEYGVYVTGGGTLTLTSSTVTKSGDTSDSTSSSSAGLNAGVIALDGSTINLSDVTINTTGTGANAVYAIGEGSTITVADVTINCTADFAHGVDALEGGTLILENVTITTAGAHGGAIVTDAEGGTVTVTGGTAVTSGAGSPGLYSTGDITVTGATLSASGTEVAAIAAGAADHTITVTDSVLTGGTRGVFILNTASGGEFGESKASTFTMTGGSLTAEAGPAFYATNTEATFVISGVTVSAVSGILLKAAADNWGTSGSNGGNITFTADAQTLVGDVVTDAISTITASLSNSSALTGTINGDNTTAGINLTLDSSSTWSVTGNSYLTTLTDEDTTLANIADNGYTIYYDSSQSANSWLNGATYSLTDGGQLTPA